MEKEYKILPKVTAILQDSELSSKNTNHKKLRVCAYARVSTEKEEQEYSFEKQKEYYIKYISNHSNWEFVGIYSDFGLSGKNKKRPQFMKMIEDCNCGKIDKIITKSVSRFARNTIDCIQTVRELREKGIGVYFEREGLDSLDSKSNLVLSIMAIVAEEESRSISNNIKWGIQKRFAKGHYLIHTKNFLGYSRENYDNVVIIPKQALTVRKIYQLCLDGKTLRQIVAELEMNGIETPCGNKKWRESTVLSILKNEKYKGDCLLQKTYTADFLSSKRCKNTGQLKSYYVKCHHAPIVSEQTFEKVQKELQWRRGLQMGTKVYPSKYSGKTFLSGLIICGQCGGIMRRHIQYRSYGGAGYWVCQRHDQGNCVMLQIKEKAIIESLQMVLRQILFKKENVYNEIIEIALNAIKVGKSVSLKKLNAKIWNTRNKLENRTLEVNKEIGESSDISDRNFRNVMFISDTPDKASEVIKSYLEDEFGANVITVMPNGYEIQNEKASTKLASPIIYPGDEMTDNLKQENTVLFLPNLDQMEDKIYRRLLLNTAREHIVADLRNKDGGFTLLDASFFALAIVGHMPGPEMYELATMDAKDSFRAFDIVSRFADDYCSYGFGYWEDRSSSPMRLEKREDRITADMEKYYAEAKKLLLENRTFLDNLAKRLQEKDTLVYSEIREIKQRSFKIYQNGHLPYELSDRYLEKKDE